MPKAAFLYLEHDDQVAVLEALLASCQPWLARPVEVDSEAQAGRLRAIVESPEQVRFCWLDEIGSLADWPIGRAFGKLGELTWRCEDGLIHVVVVTDADTLPPQLAETGIELTLMLETWSDRVRLWGVRQETGVWLEGRVPTPLSYPLHGAMVGSKATLLLKRYRSTDHENTGYADFVRYVDLE